MWGFAKYNTFQYYERMTKISFLSFIRIYWILVSGLYLSCSIPNLHSQSTLLTDSILLLSSIEYNTFRESSDSTFQFFLSEVQKKCGKDLECQSQTLTSIFYHLEEKFDLPTAVQIGQELINVLDKTNNLKKKVKIHRDLSNFFNAMGLSRQAIIHIEKAKNLLESIGDKKGLIDIERLKIRFYTPLMSAKEINAEEKKLLEKAIAQKDTAVIKLLYHQIAYTLFGQKEFEQSSNYLDKLEEILEVDTKHINYGLYNRLYLARARIPFELEQWEAADHYFQKLLEFLKVYPDKWIEIYVYRHLALLEWARENQLLAKSYLKNAENLALSLNLDDHLEKIYGIKADFAAQEKRYEEAFLATQKKYFHQEKFKSKSKNFDVQNYYLQLEKDQLATEKENKELELTLQKSRLRTLFISVFLALLLAGGFVLAFITQRRQKKVLANQNTLIRKQTQKLEQLDASKTRFFANVSHELRTPISLILGPIHSVLKDPQLSAKQSKLLNMAADNGKQLERLVTEILDLGKLEIGKINVEKKPTHLSSFFNNYCAQFESLAQRKNIHYTIDNQLDSTIYAAIDQEKSRQILYNLLSNAFKFTTSEGRIKVGLALTQLSFQLTVEDSGQGIHAEDIPKLFDRYFQTSRPDKPADGGTGIGLAICKEYTKLLNGKIEVQSTLGQGSTFLVSFPVEIMKSNAVQEHLPAPKATKPLKPELETTEPIPTGIPGAAKTKKPKLLIVEDNPELQDYISFILSEHYAVSTADNGKEALKLLKGKTQDVPPLQPDLIISDLMMPIMDGFQLLSALKSNDTTRHLPVIMLTARAELKDKLHALRIGVDDYIVKPFDEEELLARIQNLLTYQASRIQEIGRGEDISASPEMGAEDRDWLAGFETFVQDKIGDNTLSIPDLAEAFAMSESTLLRQLKRLTGLTPKKYLQEIRLHQARTLLENRTYNSISTVASKVGYDDHRSFSRSFKKRFGKLPSDLLNN